SGARISVGMIDFGASRLVLEIIDGKLEVSTTIRDKNGNLIAELSKNEWKTSPDKAWDRNYTANALEVRNAAGKIVLQVVLLSDRIQIQGEWLSPNGHGIRIVKNPKNNHGLMIGFQGEVPKDTPEIEPIFNYPSSSHFGELKKKR